MWINFSTLKEGTGIFRREGLTLRRKKKRNKEPPSQGSEAGSLEGKRETIFKPSALE